MKTPVAPEAVAHYPEVLRVVREVARSHGYAVGVHGSQARDLDLIAAPWAAESETGTAPELALAIVEALGGSLFWAPGRGPEFTRAGRPGHKPHGRLVWSILLPDGGLVDLSVMPPPIDLPRGY